MNKEEFNQIKTNQTVRINYLKDDFETFFIYYFTNFIKYPFASFHYDYFKNLEKLSNKTIDELVVIGFRESAKTSIAKAFVIWCIIYKKALYINYDSYDKGNSESALFDIVLQLQTNKKLIEDFGELYNMKRDANEITRKRVGNFITNNGVKVEAFSTQESPRGRIHIDQRPDLVVIDDFENEKTKKSLLITKKVIEHIDTFSKALDSANGRILYIANLITEYGSVAHIRDKKNPKKVVMNIPVAYNWNTDNVELTWKDKYTITGEEGKIDLIAMQKKDGNEVFFPEMLNEPRSADDKVFFETWFQYEDWNNVKKLQTRRFLSIDPIGKETDDGSGDYVGLTRCYVDRNENWYIKSERRHINATELVDLIFAWYNEDRFEKIGIEKTTFTEGLKPYIRTEMNKRVIQLPLVDLKHGGTHKETRIRGLVPYYQQKKIYHIKEEGENMCNDLERELLAFPLSPFDDTMDSLAYMLQIAKAPHTPSRQQLIQKQITRMNNSKPFGV